MGDGLSKAHGNPALDALRWSHVAEAIEELAQAHSLDAIVEILRRSARRAVGADGIAVVLRDGALCHYIAEDAKEPLWAGQRFPAETCISGWAMMYKETVVINDVFQDIRVPHEAYRQTFVRSMIMVPIGKDDPVAAVGAYWSEASQPSATEIALLESLSRAASTSLENGRLFSSLEMLNAELEKRVIDRTAELERTQEALRQTQKMEAIGQLTGNIAHDFNNLLSPIMGALDRVLAMPSASRSITQSASLGMQAAEKARTLIQRLLAFARRQPLIPAKVDLSELIDGMQELFASTLGSHITLDVRIDQNTPPIWADRHQLEMAILNLVVNARDAMSPGGTLTISAQVAGAPLPTRLTGPAYVSLSVRDTGSGMDAKTLKTATEPFFTTKDAGHGTGLGLSMVDGLVNQLGGALAIDSRVGEGTEVRLWLPMTRAGMTSEAEEVDMAQSVEGDIAQARLLLVDDDALVRMGTSGMLSDMGYEVTEADDANDALKMIEDGLAPEVVITDHIMPGMTGAEFALRLRSDHPEMAVMIISGYQGIDLIAPDIVRLSKPFRQAHLATSIAAARAQVQPTMM